MQTGSLVLFRLCLAAWVGVACFFLATVIGLRSSIHFSEQVKLEHPKILFPLYYAFEFVLLGAALLGAGLARGTAQARRSTFRWAAALALISLLVAAADYALVYRALATMMVQQPLPREFGAYHHASRWINAVVVVLTAIAATLAVWPERDRRNQDSPTQ